MGCPYNAVGMQRASDSAIGLPSRSTSAFLMLVFLMPADVRRSFMRPPGVVAAGVNVLGAYGSGRGRDWQTTENSSAPARFSLTRLREAEPRPPVADPRGDCRCYDARKDPTRSRFPLGSSTVNSRIP